MVIGVEGVQGVPGQLKVPSSYDERERLLADFGKPLRMEHDSRLNVIGREWMNGGLGTAVIDSVQFWRSMEVEGM